MSFPEKQREIPLLSYINALLKSRESLLPTSITLCTVTGGMSQPRRAPLAGYVPDRLGFPAGPLCFTFQV